MSKEVVVITAADVEAHFGLKPVPEASPDVIERAKKTVERMERFERDMTKAECLRAAPSRFRTALAVRRYRRKGMWKL